MGVDPWVDRGTRPPAFLSGGDARCFVPPTFSRVDIFCTNAHWMTGAIFVKFSQLIVATRCQILRLKCTKFNFDWKITALPQTP